MGLDEKRHLAKIRETHIPRFQAEMKAAAGFDLVFDIDLATFPENKSVLAGYENYFESMGPGLVVSVVKSICKDSLGKEALKEKVKKIVLQNTAKSENEKGHMEVKLEGDTLFVREGFYGYADVLFREDALRTAVESLL